MKINLISNPDSSRFNHVRAEYQEPVIPRPEEEWECAHLIPPHPVPSHTAEGKRHRHPVPPHKKRRFNLEAEEEDFEIFVRIFGDEDSAAAALYIIQDAPPEIAVLAAQISEMIRRIEKC